MCELTPAEVYREHVRKARLVHDCDSCGGAILPGDEYVYTSGIWDGEPQDYKRHELCALLERRTRDMDGCGVGLGELFEAHTFRSDASWVFRTAWETVMRRAWGGCSDCGGHIPYRHPGQVCPACLGAEEDDAVLALRCF